MIVKGMVIPQARAARSGDNSANTFKVPFHLMDKGDGFKADLTGSKSKDPYNLLKQHCFRHSGKLLGRQFVTRKIAGDVWVFRTA